MQKQFWTINNTSKYGTQVTNIGIFNLSQNLCFHLQEDVSQRSPLNDHKKHQLCLDRDCSACPLTE